MADHPAWHLPLGYKDGVYGAELVPSGAYLGDRDMFVFVVDGNRDLDDPTDRTQAGLFRGFILRNSDVGAAALTLDLFLFRMVCGNHIIWGFEHVATFRRRHVGASIQRDWSTSLQTLQTTLDADTAQERTLLLRASSQELGATREAVLEAAMRRLELSQKSAHQAYELAEQFDWELPDVIMYPTGGGTGLIGMWKAFDEMEQMGWIGSKRPRMVTVQAAGCAPIVRAFEEGKRFADEFANAHTTASGLRVPKAIGDFLILDALRASGGTAIAVTDRELVAATREIGAAEGIFCAPEGAACLPALNKLLAAGAVKQDQRVVLFNTGSGVKYAESFSN